MCLCANSEIDAAKERANRILSEAETSPNYQKLLDRGDARNVGDLCAAGDEDSILARFKQFADAGVTDLSVRLLPIGDTRDELIASKYRTREVIAELAAEGRAMSGPLAGIRILEVGVMLAGPYATMLLADLGAEVIKIEPPGGEISRQVSDSYFASLNRNKRSVCLDLRSDEGQRRLGELVADSHALLVNMKPSAIRKLGLTYEALRQYNEKIVCVALTGYGLDGGDDPAFDYVIQAATGVAAMTGDPDGPPTLPGYSSADNSTGLTAALGLLAQIVSGRGGQVDVSLRDVMLSQLNYRASAYLNDGIEPQRHPFGAHSYYVPAQLFPTADGYLALFITHDAFWRSFAAEAGIDGLPDDGRARRAPRRGARRGDARRWPPTPRRVGRRGCVRSAFRRRRCGRCPRRSRPPPRSIVTAGDFRLVGSPIRVAGYDPDYRPAPRLDEHARGSLVVVHVTSPRRVRHGLTGQHVAVGDLVVVSASLTRIVALPSVSVAMQVPQLPASHENGGASPARRALSSRVSPGLAAPSPSCGRGGW